MTECAAAWYTRTDAVKYGTWMYDTTLFTALQKSFLGSARFLLSYEQMDDNSKDMRLFLYVAPVPTRHSDEECDNASLNNRKRVLGSINSWLKGALAVRELQK